MTIKERVDPYVTKVVSDLGFDLVDFNLFSAGKQYILRIYIDKDGGVTISDCSKVSHELGILFDLENLIEDNYTLEVSSPGVDRKLESTKDFQRNKGRLVRLTFEEAPEAIAPKKFIVGKLLEVKEESIVVKGPKKDLEFLVNDILTAKVELQF